MSSARRFEQLCINFANEALQQFFVQSVFVTETREYMKQGLSGWQTVPFKDNQENIDIILRRPVGLLSFLDQQVLLGDRCVHACFWCLLVHAHVRVCAPVLTRSTSAHL